MRITDYTLSQQLLYQFGNSSQALSKSYSELSSGQKIVKPSDDPTQASYVLSQQSDLRRNSQFLSNVTRADQLSTVTYANVKNLKDLVTRASELGTKITDLSDATVFTANKTEVNGLIEQAIQLMNTQQNGEYIFAGTKSTTSPITVTRDTNGTATAVAYAGGSTASSIAVSENISVTPYSSATQNQQIIDTINHLITLRDAMEDNDASAVRTATATITDDEDLIINQMSDHATVQSRLDLLSAQLKTSATATTTEISARADVDIAEATVRYNMMQNAYQASIAAGSKMLSVSLLDYL